MPALATNLVRDFSTLAALAPRWWELWESSPSATPFQSPAWLLSWWAEFHPGELLCGIAMGEDRLKALFPFYLEEAKGGSRLLPIGISLSDYLDVLVDPQCPDAADAVTTLMCEGPWASWSFEEMPPGAVAAGLHQPVSCLENLSRQETCPVLQLPEGCDLESCVPARRRRQLRRARVIAASLGETRIRRCEDDSQRFLDVLFALHRARWRERDESGVLADPHVQNFHRTVLPRLAAAGLARCYLLALGGRPIAAYYGLLHRGRAYAYLGGFDPNFAEASPGAILIGQAIADAISRRRAANSTFCAVRRLTNIAGEHATGGTRAASGRRHWSMREPAGLASALDRLLGAYCAGEMPAGVVLMHLALSAGNARELAAALDARTLDARLNADATTAQRIEELTGLASSDAFETVRQVSSTLSHEPRPQAKTGEAVKQIAAAFDRAVSVSPEGSVALYSLGRPDILEGATSEIVDFMGSLGLLGPERVLLDIGCGIGRFELALAPHVRRILGVDISAGMIETARRRCASHENASFRLSRGTRLPRLAASSFDCIFAVDSFPYIVQADPELPGRYVKDAARLLKSGADLLIFNYSYRADRGADARDVERLASLDGFEILRVDERPFHLWDGRVFHLRKSRRSPPRRPSR